MSFETDLSKQFRVLDFLNAPSDSYYVILTRETFHTIAHCPINTLLSTEPITLRYFRLLNPILYTEEIIPSFTYRCISWRERQRTVHQIKRPAPVPRVPSSPHLLLPPTVCPSGELNGRTEDGMGRDRPPLRQVDSGRSFKSPSQSLSLSLPQSTITSLFPPRKTEEGESSQGPSRPHQPSPSEARRGGRMRDEFTKCQAQRQPPAAREKGGLERLAGAVPSAASARRLLR